MCFSPNSTLVQQAIDLNYEKKKRESSLKWFFVNALLFLVFTYDLSCSGPCPASGLHYAEFALAAVLCANLLQHARRLLPRRAHPEPGPSPRQRRLLGLSDADLTDLDRSAPRASAAGGGGECSLESAIASASDAELSLSPSPRRWAAGAHTPSPSPSPPPSPPSPTQPASPARPGDRLAHDRFIADRRSLDDYLREYELGRGAEAGAAGEGGGATWSLPPSAPPLYQLAAPDSEGGALEEGSPEGSPQVWWQLDLDPQRLTQWNFNLRLWIHLTIVERLVRAMAETDAALERVAGGARLGALPVDRLRALAAAHPAALPALPALLPYLEPYADQRYVVQRIRELARGGCLSEYKWNAGGSGWDESQPCDADLLLHLFATYLDGQMPMCGNARPFSSEYLSGGGAAGRDGLALRRVSARPPQWALALGEELVAAPRGRANLLHALLLLLAAAARRSPPALARRHLGPAGLNMLWIIGR